MCYITIATLFLNFKSIIQTQFGHQERLDIELLIGLLERREREKDGETIDWIKIIFLFYY
jgi:hypothetical protein